MLENPECLQDMVKRSGAHSTDMQSPESAEHLCGKCVPYAENWVDTADKLWHCSHSCASCGGCHGKGEKTRRSNLTQRGRPLTEDFRKEKTKMNLKLFTSESVTEGHPDKLCDAISDAVLDAFLALDPLSRVACETCCTTDYVLVMGEITSRATVDIERVVRDAILQIGYTGAESGLDGNTCKVEIRLDRQSDDIALGVNQSAEAKAGNYADTGAGDQGMMFGYASNETEEYMPFAITMAHRLTRRLAQVRKSGELPYLRPDGKSQVTVQYDSDGTPVWIDTIVISAQHDESVSQEQLRADIWEKVIRAVVPQEMVDDATKIFINPTGRFVVGGPHGDSGLTGRKIIVDTYGGYARHGGGAFSGKDPTKVDRSAAYAARYIAKNIVAAGLASACEIQLSYAIGVAEPVSVSVDTFGTGKISDAQLCTIIRKTFELRPAGIIGMLGLREPLYQNTSAYGHFGRPDELLPWERLDRVEKLLRIYHNTIKQAMGVRSV